MNYKKEYEKLKKESRFQKLIILILLIANLLHLISIL